MVHLKKSIFLSSAILIVFGSHTSYAKAPLTAKEVIDKHVQSVRKIHTFDIDFAIQVTQRVGETTEKTYLLSAWNWQTQPGQTMVRPRFEYFEKKLSQKALHVDKRTMVLLGNQRYILDYLNLPKTESFSLPNPKFSADMYEEENEDSILSGTKNPLLALLLRFHPSPKGPIVPFAEYVKGMEYKLISPDANSNGCLGVHFFLKEDDSKTIDVFFDPNFHYMIRKLRRKLKRTLNDQERISDGIFTIEKFYKEKGVSFPVAAHLKTKVTVQGKTRSNRLKTYVEIKSINKRAEPFELPEDLIVYRRVAEVVGQPPVREEDACIMGKNNTPKEILTQEEFIERFRNTPK
ncbi:MAG: hypothetical protein PVH19_13085 [Planctomycetia bacterium]|jgi:hypothetical protein